MAIDLSAHDNEGPDPGTRNAIPDVAILADGVTYLERVPTGNACLDLWRDASGRAYWGGDGYPRVTAVDCSQDDNGPDGLCAYLSCSGLTVRDSRGEEMPVSWFSDRAPNDQQLRLVACTLHNIALQSKPGSVQRADCAIALASLRSMFAREVRP